MLAQYVSMGIHGFENKEKDMETMGTWSEVFTSTKLFGRTSFSWKFIDFRADYPE